MLPFFLIFKCRVLPSLILHALMHRLLKEFSDLVTMIASPIRRIAASFTRASRTGSRFCPAVKNRPYSTLNRESVGRLMRSRAAKPSTRAMTLSRLTLWLQTEEASKIGTDAILHVHCIFTSTCINIKVLYT